MLFNIRGEYRIVIDDNLIEPISNLFPHSFEYKIGENGNWISAPEGAPFSYPSTPQIAVLDIYGDVEPTNDLVYFRIDLRDYGYENYLETNIVGQIQDFFGVGTFIVNEGLPIDFSYVPSLIEGCTDEYALNYLPEATSDDGSCEYDEVSFDINNDGDSNILDVVQTVEIVLNEPNPSLDNYQMLDLNNDNTINVLDVILMVSFILGRIGL